MQENKLIVLPDVENYKEVVSRRNRYYNKSNWFKSLWIPC